MVREAIGSGGIPPVALATDFNGPEYPPEEAIRDMATFDIPKAHWRHDLEGERFYTRMQVRGIRNILDETGVQLLDTHAPDQAEGDGAYWLSEDEAVRKKGVALIQNRMEMTAELGGLSVVLHAPSLQDAAFNMRKFHQSMSELQMAFRHTGTQIALETLRAMEGRGNNFDTIARTMEDYDESFVGICFDSANWDSDKAVYGYDRLAAYSDRIIAVHLHDRPKVSDASEDQLRHDDDHRLPFTGDVDWAKVCDFLGQSNYFLGTMTGESMVAAHKGENMTKETFLERARDSAILITRVVSAARGKSSDEVGIILNRHLQGGLTPVFPK